MNAYYRPYTAQLLPGNPNEGRDRLPGVGSGYANGRSNSAHSAPLERPTRYPTTMAERYREAIRVMGDDAVELRTRVRDVEAANAMLRRDLAARIIGGPPMIEPMPVPIQSPLVPLTAFPPPATALVAAAPIPPPAPVTGVPVRVEDGVFLVHPNVAEKYLTMREELRRATEELLALRNRTEDLEQTSTKKEQESEDLDRLRATNHSQLLLIQNLQEKLGRQKKLEDLIRGQEVVIEKMERALDQQHNECRTAACAQLKLENERLRDLLQDLKETRSHVSPAEPPQPPARTHYEHQSPLPPQPIAAAGVESSMSDVERTQMHELLDRAERRIAHLERELRRKRQKWTREREDILRELTRLPAQCDRCAYSGGRTEGFACGGTMAAYKRCC